MRIVSPRLRRLAGALGIVGGLASVFAFVTIGLLQGHPMTGGLESIPPQGLSYEQKVDLWVHCLVGSVGLALVGLFYLGSSLILFLFSKRSSP